MIIEHLDLLTASQGGVCAIVGDACCTWIPEDDADGHSIALAVDNLKKLLSDELKDSTGQAGDWFENLFSGLSFSPWLQRVFFTFLMIMTLLCVVFCCVIPLMRRLVHSAVSTAFVQYLPLPKGDIPDNPLDDLPFPPSDSEEDFV